MSENRDNCGNNFFYSASHMRSEITRKGGGRNLYVVNRSMLYMLHGAGWKFDGGVFPSIFHSKTWSTIWYSVRRCLHEAHSIPINIPQILLTSILITRTSRYTKNKFSWPFDAHGHSSSRTWAREWGKGLGWRVFLLYSNIFITPPHRYVDKKLLLLFLIRQTFSDFLLIFWASEWCLSSFSCMVTFSSTYPEVGALRGPVGRTNVLHYTKEILP